MATAAATRHITVASLPSSSSSSFSTAANRTDRKQQLNTSNDSNRTMVHRQLINPTPEGVPVKFADNLFSILVKDQITQLLDSPRIKHLKYTDENAVRTVTFDITEIIKRIVVQHIKDNYKVVIQVMTYPKQDENSLLIMSRCLWNYRTDDVLSVEVETDTFKFVIVIHGVVA